MSGFNVSSFIYGGNKPLRDSTIWQRSKRFAEQAGIKRIRIHAFRHSHASLLANAGINIQAVTRRLGHAKVEMTWNTYSHLYPREEERAVEVLLLHGTKSSGSKRHKKVGKKSVKGR